MHPTQTEKTVRPQNRKICPVWPFLFLPVAAFLGGCPLIEIAPVDDGSYLRYTVTDHSGKTADYLVCFSAAHRGLLEVKVVEPDAEEKKPAAQQPPSGDDLWGDEAGSDEESTPDPLMYPDDNGTVLVTRFLKRRGGSRLELSGFGPVWLPTLMLRNGGEFPDGPAYGHAKADSVVQWNGRAVYAMHADDGDAAVKGTWYYSAANGVLVGCEIEPLMSNFLGAGARAGVVLTGSNVSGL